MSLEEEEPEAGLPRRVTRCIQTGSLQTSPDVKPWRIARGLSEGLVESEWVAVPVFEPQKGEGVDESKLIKRLQRREERAFNVLVTRYQGRIFNLCFRMLGNAAEAEDLAQDVFVKAFQAIGRFRGDSSLGTWLYRIAANLCKNRLKYLARRSYKATSQFEDVPESAFAGGGSRPTTGEPAARPDQAFEGNRAQTRVQRALAAVDPSFRELLVLRDIQGLSYAEVKRITGLPEGTVKSRLHRARTALKRAYEALEESP